MEEVESMGIMEALKYLNRKVKSILINGSIATLNPNPKADKQVALVTELTKAQLDALVAANGLNEGLQYKVTDKDWLLLATSDNTANSLTSFLFVQNGEWIPDYISCNNILVDSGIVDLSGHDESNGKALLIEVKSGYYLKGVYLSDINLTDASSNYLKVLDDNDSQLINIHLSTDASNYTVNSSIDSNIEFRENNIYYRIYTDAPLIDCELRITLDLEKSKI